MMSSPSSNSSQPFDPFDPFGIERQHSLIERAGQVVGICVALATLIVIDWSTWVLPLWNGEPLAPGSTLFQFDAWLISLLPAFLLLTAAQYRLPPQAVRRAFMLLALVIVGTAIGYGLHAIYSELCLGEGIAPRRRPMVVHTIGVAASMMALLGECRRRQVEAAEALREVTLNSLRLQTQLSAGHLNLLTAQIEPHFLFNSLANVKRLLRVDGPAGRRMLKELLRYLETALPQMRDDRPTLAREFELVRAFLAVQQVRFGTRLDVRIDLPEALSATVVPPMMVLTLVENALKHGIGPLVEGGAIHIAASAETGGLRLRVADTGRGLQAGTGRGTGLANIQARLRAAYGGRARLSMQVNVPRGVVAMIDLPATT